VGNRISRRTFLGELGAGAVVLGTGPTLWRQPSRVAAPAIEQVHLQFGRDAAGEMTVSWVTKGSVAKPRLRWGSKAAGIGEAVDADTRTYRDHATGREVVVHHATLTDLAPDAEYVYQPDHQGAERAVEVDSFRTAPRGPAKFRFTSFGDQGIEGVGVGSAASDRVVDHVEEQAPLFHLVNGDLAYSDLMDDPATAWDQWFTQNQRSAAARPWMAAAGNHEQETGNGDHGYRAFQTRFHNPDNGVEGLGGLFYAFTVGSVRFVVLQNDDVCYQWGSNDYVRGYSGGAQKAWLDRTLGEARDDPGVDWVVVCMHQLVMSSATLGNGGDRGVREEFAPLFDEHEVDLVLCGHDHDYERTHPVRGVDADSPTLRPKVAGADVDGVVDATQGAVHLVLGGGGAVPRNEYGHGPRGARVVVGKGQHFIGEYEFEEPTWSAKTDPAPGKGYGFAAFDVDPGDREGATTSIDVTYYRTAARPGQAAEAFDRIRLEKPRTARSVAPAAAGDEDRDDDGTSWPIVVGAAAFGTAALAALGGGAVLYSRRNKDEGAEASDPDAGAGADADTVDVE